MVNAVDVIKIHLDILGSFPPEGQVPDFYLLEKVSWFGIVGQSYATNQDSWFLHWSAMQGYSVIC